jgi:hypothetical protein
MGMLDRDYYQEHWAEKVLGIKPKHKPKASASAAAQPAPVGAAERGPIYVNRSGDASRTMHPDPRMHAIYARREANARAWRVFWAWVAFAVIAFTVAVLILRAR